MTLHPLYPFPVLKQSLFAMESKLRSLLSHASITGEAKLDYIDHLKYKVASIQSHPSFIVRARDPRGNDKGFREYFWLCRLLRAYI